MPRKVTGLVESEKERVEGEIYAPKGIFDAKQNLSASKRTAMHYEKLKFKGSEKVSKSNYSIPWCRLKENEKKKLYLTFESHPSSIMLCKC